jgi:hypothetical protein
MTGRKIYVPKIILMELEDLKTEHNIPKNSTAFKEIAKYSQAGREAERIIKFNFKHKWLNYSSMMGSKKRRKNGI